MKASSISTLAVNQAMRYQMTRMQADLIKAEKEIVTGKAADTGLAIGARTGTSVSLDRDIDRLKGIKVSNSIAEARVSTTQAALNGLDTITQRLSATLTTALTGSLEKSVLLSDAEGTLATMDAVINTKLNGEYIFAGANTDFRPLADFRDPASPARQRFDEIFETKFGHGIQDAASADITADEMNEFLDEVETLFFGSEWNDFVSEASDQTIQSRITLNENASTSVSANVQGIRGLTMAAASVFALMQGPISDAAQDALINRTVAITGQAIGDLTETRASLGLVENRISEATERLSNQIDLLTRNQTSMVGVDPYEASTRITALMAQIETSYTLTNRMQQLSLIRFLT